MSTCNIHFYEHFYKRAIGVRAIEVLLHCGRLLEGHHKGIIEANYFLLERHFFQKKAKYI